MWSAPRCFLDEAEVEIAIALSQVEASYVCARKHVLSTVPS